MRRATLTLGALLLLLAQAASALSLDGRVQLETAQLRGRFTEDGRPSAASDVRRAELSVQAPLAPQLQASVTVALDEGQAVLDEALLTWRPEGLGAKGLALQLGRFDPDFGLDPSSSSNWTLALERSPIFDLAPDAASGDNSLGLRADHAGQHHVLSGSLMAGEDRDQAVFRAVRLGLEPGRVWQLGASLALGSGLADDGRLRSRLGLRATTEAERGRRSTLARALRGGDTYGRDLAWVLEAALQQGPWLVQTEWLQRRLDGASAGSAPRSAQGQTLALGWVLQGAPRRHDARRARFGRPGDAGPAGTWEAVVRLDRLRVQGAGDAQVLTLGLAWSAAATWRVAGNLVWARADDANAVGQRSGTGLALRLQALF